MQLHEMFFLTYVPGKHGNCEVMVGQATHHNLTFFFFLLFKFLAAIELQQMSEFEKYRQK